MKFIKILVGIVIVVVSLFVLLWLVLFAAKHILYSEYLKDRERECEIPDQNSGFIPQGITYLQDIDAYIQTGYNGDNLAMYYVDQNETKSLIPLDEEGSRAESHGGGVASAGDFVYVADGSSLLVYSLAELLETPDGGEVECKGRVPVDNKASFCFADGKNIYVGEFYRAGNYETDMQHAYTTPSGTENRAVLSCYELAEDGSFLDEIPEYRLSIPGLVQGFAVNNGVVALSRSYGLNSSSLEFYDGMLDSGMTVNIDEKEVPLYYLDNTNLIKALTIPAFSEDMTVKDGRVVISFESASNKYIVGKLFFAYAAYSYPFPVK